MRLTQQSFQTLLALLWSREEGVEDSHATQINTITSDLSQPSKSFVSSRNIRDRGVWTFDSRATDHVSYSLGNFLSYKTIKNIPVNLPNNSKVIATHIGRVKLNERLILNNVFIFQLLNIIWYLFQSLYLVLTLKLCLHLTFASFKIQTRKGGLV